MTVVLQSRAKVPQAFLPPFLHIVIAEREARQLIVQCGGRI